MFKFIFGQIICSLSSPDILPKHNGEQNRKKDGNAAFVVINFVVLNFSLDTSLSYFFYFWITLLCC